MTLDEVRSLKRVLRERIQVFGQCKWLAIARGEVDKCECALCQLDDMGVEELKETVDKLIGQGYNGFETRAFIT